MIKRIWKFKNGMVACVDENDQQMKDLQGRYEDVVDLVFWQAWNDMNVFAVKAPNIDGYVISHKAAEHFTNIMLELTRNP